MLRYYIQPKRKMRPSKRTVRFETQPGYQLQHDWGEVEVEVAGQRCKVNFAVNTLGFSRRFHVFAAPKQDAEHTPEQEHLQPLPSSALSAVSTVNFVSIRENWLRSASVLRPLASSAARTLSVFSSTIYLSTLLEWTYQKPAITQFKLQSLWEQFNFLTLVFLPGVICISNLKDPMIVIISGYVHDDQFVTKTINGNAAI